MRSLMYASYAYCTRSSRAPRTRVLGIVISSCSSLRTLDSRAPRTRVLAYDLGHPTGDSPCYIIPSGTDVSLVAFESLVRVLAELAHVSDKTRAFLPLPQHASC